ncbi:hypothetical protein [Kitasatospora azatica]|uniref:hypothetical protein n=1 Tax=Kitasatospora azatica TaxID=58347 RepID=UPI000B149437|nr:hypothetical protein [Kitasatospora azatica]
MDRKKIPRTIDATGTFVIDPEDEAPSPHETHCARPCCRPVEAPSHWGQWLRPA